MGEACTDGGKRAAASGVGAAPALRAISLDSPLSPGHASGRRIRPIQRRAWCSIGGLVGLLELADCSGNSGIGAPSVVFTTPSSATELSSDRPEIPGEPLSDPNLPATIPTSGPNQR